MFYCITTWRLYEHVCLYHALVICLLCTFMFSEEFAVYLKYTRQLDFYEAPNYDHLRQLFANVMARNDWLFDWVFDWTSHSQVW